MDNKGKILIVDDNQDVLLSLNILLKRHVEAVRVLTKPDRIGEFMDTFCPDVILLDMNFRRDVISGEEGYKWLDFILKKDPKAVVLFITAYVDTEKAVRAIKAGAVDFIPKPWDNDKLLGIVQSAVELRQSRKSPTSNFPVDLSLDGDGNSTSLTPLIGESPAMLAIKEQISRIASTEANVLITGENGTGKDVVAHLLHSNSPRADRPFVTIDLGTVPEQLFESELFGYEKGAFTDARSPKAGRIECADTGTLFLDEIGNLNASAQQKLLTIIEKRELSRLGSNKTKKVDVRLIVATNADLGRMVAEGSFRQDLLYRLNTIQLQLPSLSQRGDDIILLAEYFAEKLSSKYHKQVTKLSDKAKAKLMSHTWPGNVRELQHVIERAIVLAQKDFLDEDDIAFSQIPAKSDAQTSQMPLNLEELERNAIMRALELCNGNLTSSASLLGITRYALYRKIEKYGL